jgi:hypothetical protein
MARRRGRAVDASPFPGATRAPVFDQRTAPS